MLPQLSVTNYPARCLYTLGLCLAPTFPAHAGDETTLILIISASIILLFAVIFIPTYVAFKREHPNRWLIFIFNIAFGGTIIGWFIALIWALHYAHKSASGSNGGESGLNIFINDTRKVRLEPPMHTATSNNSTQTQENKSNDRELLQRLKTMLLKDIITRREYDLLKQTIIDRYLMSSDMDKN